MRISILIVLLSLVQLIAAQETTTLVPHSDGIGYEAVNWNPHNGRIMVPDFTFNQVHEIFLDGTRSVLLDSINQPLGGAWDNEGNFYVSEYGGPGKLIRIAPDGTSSELASNLGGPAGLLVDSSQQIIYIADYDGSVIRRYYMADGTTDVLVAGQGLNGPDCIVYAPNGDLIVNNFNNNQIFRITPDGEINLFATLNGSLNSGYLVRTANEYIVAGYYSHRLWRVDYDGTSSVWAGQISAGATDGDLSEARFTRPNGIAISADQDSIILSDGGQAPRIRLITNVGGTVSNTLGLHALDFQLTPFPNPATDQLNIKFNLKSATSMRLSVLNLTGQELHLAVDSTLQAGEHQYRWDIPQELPNGYYQCLIETDQYISTKAVLINR